MTRLKESPKHRVPRGPMVSYVDSPKCSQISLLFSISMKSYFDAVLDIFDLCHTVSVVDLSAALCLTFTMSSEERGSTIVFSMLGSLLSPSALWADMYIYTPRRTEPVTKNTERSKGLRTSGNNPQ